MGLIDSIAGSDAAPPDNGRSAFDFFIGQGLAPHQAAGIVGNLQGESGQGLNPNAINKGDGRDGSDSIGIGQWNGTRAQALKDYAASKGTDWNDLNTQLEFLHSELKGPEAKAYAGLTAAQTPEEAGQAMLAYERPKDWNKAGAHPERAQYAAKAFTTYGGQTVADARPINSQTYPNGYRTMNVGGYDMPQLGGPSDYAPKAPLRIAPQAPPIFAPQPPQAPQQQSQAEPSPFEQIPPMQMAPIFAPQRRSPDLSKLRAAFGSQAPIFRRG